ncbi:MAG: TIGR04222 domain-containing membrane protein [Labedaea sp.]
MDQPWGLSGPQFVELYAVGFLAALVLMFVIQALLSRVGARGVGADVRLDVYEAAYLAGGRPRLVDTAIAGMALRDQLLVARDGRLTTVAHPGWTGPIESAVCRAVGQHTSQSAVHRRLRRDPALRAVAEQVRARGLVLAGGRGLTCWLVGLLPVAVLAVGVARVLNGMRLHRPVQTLVVLLGVSLLVMIGVLVVRHAAHRRRSPVGRAALRALDRQYRFTGRVNRDFELVGVAVFGYGAIADPTLRMALSTRTSSADGFSEAYSVDAGCGGGSSGCGGGGGGGCGGGGGGCGG